MRDIHAKFGISNLPQSLDIRQKSDGGNSDFRISGQSLTNKNCHKSGTSKDTGIILEPVSQLNKRNTAMSQEVDHDVMSANCDVIVMFESRIWSVILTFSLIVIINVYLTKTENRTKNSLTQLSHYCVE